MQSTPECRVHFKGPARFAQYFNSVWLTMPPNLTLLCYVSTLFPVFSHQTFNLKETPWERAQGCLCFLPNELKAKTTN